jgi:hypothetical protein
VSMGIKLFIALVFGGAFFVALGSLTGLFGHTYHWAACQPGWRASCIFADSEANFVLQDSCITSKDTEGKLCGSYSVEYSEGGWRDRPEPKTKTVEAPNARP